MAQPPKRPTTRRPRSAAATTTRRRAAAPPAPAAAGDADAAESGPKRARKTGAARATARSAAPSSASASATPRARAKAASPAPSRAGSGAASAKRHDQAEHQARDGHGRFKSSHRVRNIALGAGGAVLAVGAGLGAALWRGWVKMPRGPFGRDVEGHKAPDLALDAPKPGADRAPEAFRPDPEAVPTPEERDALRPLDRN